MPSGMALIEPLGSISIPYPLDPWTKLAMNIATQTTFANMVAVTLKVAVSVNSRRH